MNEPPPPPLTKELLRLRMRLSRLLGPYARLEDEALIDLDFVEVVVSRFLATHPRPGLPAVPDAATFQDEP